MIITCLTFPPGNQDAMLGCKPATNKECCQAISVTMSTKIPVIASAMHLAGALWDCPSQTALVIWSGIKTPKRRVICTATGLAWLIVPKKTSSLHLLDHQLGFTHQTRLIKSQLPSVTVPSYVRGRFGFITQLHGIDGQGSY